MDDSPRALLEWMRAEFESARRRRAVKPRAQGLAKTTPPDTASKAPGVEPSETTGRPDHPTAK